MPDRRALPRVDNLSESEELAQYPPKLRLWAAREALDRLRNSAQLPSNVATGALALAIELAEAQVSPSLKPVINASGVILHTGAGRARLAAEAAEQVGMVALSHSNLEIDLDTGKRGDRQSHVRKLLCQLTGAQDAFIVNNCAAAVFLSLHALANRKEVILSRGQMVEIGGSFRLPDIVRQSGCKLVEVGTTNKTRLEDYRDALTARTAVILRCHPSNYRVLGFTEEPDLADIVALTRQRSEELNGPGPIQFRSHPSSLRKLRVLPSKGRKNHTCTRDFRSAQISVSLLGRWRQIRALWEVTTDGLDPYS